MKIIVIYKSRTDFTKRYAKWISKELNCKAVDYDDLLDINLNSYDLVIYGSRINAGRIDYLNKMIKLLANKNSRLIVFATGATPLEATEEVDKIKQNNFSDDTIPFFYMQSGLCYEKMGAADKAIMKALAKMIAYRKDKSNIEISTAVAIRSSYDISNKDYILPLINFVKSLE